jgi:dienelactone hydrolase
VVVAACGSGEPAERVAELADYDESKPLRVRVEGENPGSLDFSYQSPRGGDVAATLVLPEKPPSGGAPVVVYLHPYLGSRALFFNEAFRLADAGIAALLVDSTLTRQDLPRPDLMDPVYSAHGFKALVRHDVVDARRGLDYLERRKEVDMDRVAFVGQEYGGLVGAAAAAVDERIDVLVLSAVPAEPGKYWAKEFVPQETQESFAEELADFDPIRLLDAIDADILIQNPRRDEDFPVEEYERLADEAGDAEVRWYDYGHQMGPEADDDRRAWLADKLGGE